MKRLLPLLFGAFIFLFFCISTVSAQTPTPAGGIGGGTDSSINPDCIATKPTDPWICDNEVTFIGKASSRAKSFLDWTMTNYRWADTSTSPIGSYWVNINRVVGGLLLVFVLATAFILIITRGRSVTVTRFIPRFIFAIIFAVLSFAIVSFLYQVIDIVQGFFLQGTGLSNIDPNLKVISGQNLFNISWDYKDFVGYRSTDPRNQESAWVEILLLKITAVTFYIMAGLLLIRKVILWFFIAVSPIFPFLLLYYPIRNTGKIWIGEFFRWLLYGPLFAIFLYALVALWQFQWPGAPPNATAIPLQFNTETAGKPESIVYQTAINIVIGGPGQTISRENNVNTPDTFALYVFALIMVWLVIFFPFVLLRIFLDHMNNVLGGENWLTTQLRRSPFAKPPQAPPPPGIPPIKTVIPPFSPPPPQPPPLKPAGAGLAREIPREQISVVNQPTLKTIQTNERIMRETDIKIPTLRDIARFDSATVTRDVVTQQQISNVRKTLTQIGNPLTAVSQVQRDRARVLRSELITEKQTGNQLANNILSAASVVSEKTVHAGAVPISHATITAAGLPKVPTTLPQTNRVQSVSLDDYESVKKMWKENYQKLEPPTDANGKQKDRKIWVEQDIQKIQQAINLLSTQDSLKNKEGMDMVASILPFLLIGGFSQTEVIAYLKAKVEAAKVVLEDLEAKQTEEETMVGREETKKEEKKTLEEHAELPDIEEKTPKNIT